MCLCLKAFFIVVHIFSHSNCYIQRGLEDPYAETPKCEPIRIKACQDLPYNITIFPNDMGHATQDDAAQEIGQYTPLVRTTCSSSLKLFLCSLFFPVCTGMKKPLPPCRSLCEQNRKDCEPLMRGFHFEWPEIMNCDRFPEDSLCIAENKTEKRVSKEPSFVCPVHMRVACSGPFPAPQSLSGQIEMPRLVTQGTKFEGCIILFMLLYFFSMASSIWWVVLTITWYLAAKCHWAHEAISRNAQYLHFAAWAIPAAKTIGILALGKVDGDPLSGVCFTGLTDPVILRAFLIAPLCLYLLIGTCFLFAGFVSLFRIRTIIKTGGSKTDDLEKLIMRIGVFSLLYIVPALVVIACYLHESRMSEKWMLTWYTTEVCRKVDPNQLADSICPGHFKRLVEAGSSSRSDNSDISVSQNIFAKISALEKPEFELFMIKYLMTLIVGITSGVWIWSGKTLVSWKRFFARVFRRRSCCDNKNIDLTASSTRSGLVVARRGVQSNALPTGVTSNPGSVPLLTRTIQSSHPVQPYIFSQDTTTTTSGWASRGAPSGVTAPPDISSTPVSYAAQPNWLAASPNSVQINAGLQTGMINTNAQSVVPTNSGLGLL
uniref:Frizzled-1 n=1 Tax=Schistosoma haematobium TaxID=6185 RepID=A0A095A2U4_SCHHA